MKEARDGDETIAHLDDTHFSAELTKPKPDTGILRTLYHGFGLVIPTIYLTLVTDRILFSGILLAIFLGFFTADILRFTWPAWNKLITLFGGEKSLQGFLALFLSAFAVGLILLPWQLSIIGALAAAVVEVFPFHLIVGKKLARWLDDNATIPITSGWAMTGVAVLAGWSG